MHKYRIRVRSDDVAFFKVVQERISGAVVGNTHVVNNVYDFCIDFKGTLEEMEKVFYQKINVAYKLLSIESVEKCKKDDKKGEKKIDKFLKSDKKDNKVVEKVDTETLEDDCVDNISIE